MLGLVAMATTADSLYASMKALVCIVGSNQLALREMERMGGFQVGHKVTLFCCLTLRGQLSQICNEYMHLVKLTFWQSSKLQFVLIDRTIFTQTLHHRSVYNH